MEQEEEKKTVLKIVEMIAQTQQDLVRIQKKKQNHTRDLIYKILVPLILLLLSLWLSGQLWITAKIILTG